MIFKTMKLGEVASKIRMGKKRRDQVSDSEDTNI